MNQLFTNENINIILVFVEGLLSFFSPCVLPLIPVYVSYLAGNTQSKEQDGTISYSKSIVLLHTICFVLGISFAFFVLGISFTALGTFLNQYKEIISKIAGIIIILLGLSGLGVFHFSFLEKEKRLLPKFNFKKMNPLFAFIMGFTFSFAWTPCVGPALSSVLLLASSSSSALGGNLLVLVYTLGFIIPFILLGLFTTSVLNFLKEKQKIVKYTIKISSVLLILIGVLTLFGVTNTISKQLTNQQSIQNKEEQNVTTSEQSNTQENTSSQNTNQSVKDLPKATNFTLTDQNGNTHTLSDYQGKVVFLNFWASWCGPCQMEMPHIQEVYEQYHENTEEVVILGVAEPTTEKNRFASDKTIPELKQFLAEKNYTFPTVFDETGEIFTSYYINSFPTTYMIDKQGNIYGYVSGSLSKDNIIDIIEQTLKGSE